MLKGRFTTSIQKDDNTALHVTLFNQQSDPSYINLTNELLLYYYINNANNAKLPITLMHYIFIATN